MHSHCIILLLTAVSLSYAAVEPHSWIPESRRLDTAVSDGDERTFQSLCHGSHDPCDVGLEFSPAQRIGLLQIDYATLTGHAYEPSRGGDTLQYWQAGGWRALPAERTIDYRNQGMFAPIEGSGFVRWTYRFAPIETSRIRVLLTEPSNYEDWHRMYVVREIRASLSEGSVRPGMTSTLGNAPGTPEYLASGANLAVPEARARLNLGTSATVEWSRRFLINRVAWSPSVEARVEWWDGIRFRPVELISAANNSGARFLPVSTTRLRITSQRGAISGVEASLDSSTESYTEDLKKSRFDLLGSRFRSMDPPDLAAMRGLMLPLDFAQAAIGRRADVEETHVIWNGTFLMVENPENPNWNHGAAKSAAEPDRHDRWFAFTSGSPPRLPGAQWSSVRTQYLDGWLPATVTTWRDGALVFRETLFVTAPADPAYGTIAELDVRNASQFPVRTDVALAAGRRRNYRNMGTEKTPMNFEPELTGYRLGAGDHTLTSANGEVILYAETAGRLGGTALENEIVYSLSLQAGRSQKLRFFVPSVTQSLRDARAFEDYDWSDALQRFRTYWNKTINAGMKLDVPEPGLNAIYKNLLAQALIITLDGSEVRYGSYSYEDYFGIEEGWPAIALAQYGQGDAAKTILTSMLSPELMAKSNYHHQYRNGLEPWYAVTAYRLLHDRAWLEKIAPDLQAAAEWTIKTIDDNRDAKYSGILPRHAYGGDIHTPAFSFYANATCWRGLHDTALAFRELNRLDLADRYARKADEYHQRLLTLADQLADKTSHPTFLPVSFDIGASEEHRDKEPAYKFLTPNVPADHTWAYLGNYWNLFAPMLLEVKLFDVADPRSRWIPDYMQQRGGILAGLARFTIGLDQIYGKGYIESLLEHSDRAEFATSLFGVFAHGMSENLNSFPEVAGVFPLRLNNEALWSEYKRNEWDWGFQGAINSEGQPISAGPGMALQMLRMALVRETVETSSQDTLRLLDGAPVAWLGAGKKIEVRDAPTFFGAISFQTLASSDHVDAEIQTAPGFNSRQIVLHIPRQVGARLRSVIVNGKEWPDVQGADIVLPGAGRFTIRAQF